MASTSLKEKTKRSNLTAPFNVDLGAMIPLSTFTATSNTATVTFSDIPQSYEHLQVRIIGRSDRVDANDICRLRFNSDTSSNYSTHTLSGNGATASSSGSADATSIHSGQFSGSQIGSNTFGISVIDILDYSNTNKYKTTRSITGFDGNSSGFIQLMSGSWRNNSSITTITLSPNVGTNFVTNSSFALYGIKRAGA